MKHFIKKMVISIVLAVISVAACVSFAFLGFGILTFLSLLFFVGCIFAVICEIRDYRFYKELSVQMQGKTLEEKLEILNHYEECWLSYAAPEEVQVFRDEAESHPKNKFLDYFLERASSYGK